MNPGGKAPIPEPEYAFPSTGNEWNQHVRGMTLRDWFAGQALCGLLSATGGFPVQEVTAERLYSMADAMLAERDKK